MGEIKFYKNKLYILFLFFILIISCASSAKCNIWSKAEKEWSNDENKKYKYTVVTTNDYIKNIVQIIAGNRISVYSILKPGTKPYFYEPTKKDLELIKKSDLFFYCSLDISPQLKKIIRKKKIKKKSYDIIKDLDPKRFIKSDQYKKGFDPHIWFDVDIWQKVLLVITTRLIEFDPELGNQYKSNYIRYGQTLSYMKRYVNGWISKVPEKNRVIIIQNDVFQYLLEGYGFEIYSYKDVLSNKDEIDNEKFDSLINKIINDEIPVLFTEKYFNNEFIEKIQLELTKKNYSIKLSENLYTYSLDEPGTEEYFYINAFRKNIDIIYNSLK